MPLKKCHSTLASEKKNASFISVIDELILHMGSLRRDAAGEEKKRGEIVTLQTCLNTIFVIWIIIDTIRMYQKIFFIVKRRKQFIVSVLRMRMIRTVASSEIHISLLSTAIRMCIHFFFRLCCWPFLHARSLSRFTSPSILTVCGRGFVTMDFH